jgi:hypothetical protein
MQTFKQYVSEMRLSIELPTLKGREHAAALSKMGIKAKGDLEGLQVTLTDNAQKKKLVSWMLKNGWDNVDIKDAFPELLK